MAYKRPLILYRVSSVTGQVIWGRKTWWLLKSWYDGASCEVHMRNLTTSIDLLNVQVALVKAEVKIKCGHWSNSAHFITMTDHKYKWSVALLANSPQHASSCSSILSVKIQFLPLYRSTETTCVSITELRLPWKVPMFSNLARLFECSLLKYARRRSPHQSSTLCRTQTWISGHYVLALLMLSGHLKSVWMHSCHGHPICIYLYIHLQ